MAFLKAFYVSMQRKNINIDRGKLYPQYTQQVWCRSIILMCDMKYTTGTGFTDPQLVKILKTMTAIINVSCSNRAELRALG